ncbi:MAG: hypothetical protein WB341_05480 [Terracidiphilus sp.]
MPDAKNDANAEKRKRQRSPAYPYINLETALKRAKEFYDKETRNAVNIKVAAKHWGYEEKSSGGLQTAATLLSFGLLQDEGMGDKRKLKLTQNALRILLDLRPESRERAQAIKTAALAPKIHQELWKKWGTSLPSDDSLRFTLTAEWIPPFNDKAVDGFIREYKDTIAFAKLGESDKVSLGEDGKSGDEDGLLEEQAYVPKAGDYVQWQPGGVLQFKEPKRVSRLSQDGKFAFVDGSPTGLPIGELTKQDQPEPSIQSNSPAGNRAAALPDPRRATMREDVFSLAEGNVTFQWPSPLSADSIVDLKDWFKILERKVSRSSPEVTATEQTKDREDS